MTTAAIYVRISQDREGAGLGVQRQQEDCTALCERLGWTVGDVYSDNDVSAYSGKPRPEWQRLIEDVKASAVDAIAVWHVDRLTRSPVELEHVITLADRHGLKLATVTGDVDLATPTGRMVARILGATARQEAEHKGERQKRQRRQSAEAGKPNGGGTRAYGYEDDRMTVVPDEAEVIAEAAKRALAGESLSSIARDLASRGVRTPSRRKKGPDGKPVMDNDGEPMMVEGGHWQPRTLRRLLASARISGRREHTPRPTGDNGTRPLVGDIVAEATWLAIITPEESDRLRAMLSDPERQRSTSANGRTYLLSGILRCGKCTGAMCGRPRSDVPRYVCPNQPGGTGCGGIAANAARTDDLVRDLILVALAERSDIGDRLRERDGIDPELPISVRADEAQLEELAHAWASGEITRGEWRIAREVIEARLDRNRTRLARVSAGAPLDGFTGTYEDMLARWESLNVSQRRAAVAALFDRIDVAPSNPRKKWDPDRFDPVWRI